MTQSDSQIDTEIDRQIGPQIDSRNRFDLQLWQQFIALARPYWYADRRRGNGLFLLLLLLLLLWLAAILFLLVSVVTWVGHHYFTQSFEAIAPGLAAVMEHLFNSPVIVIVGLCVIIPIFVSIVLHRPLRSHWQPWLLLGLLLLLSLSVSGLNVIISYVGRFFQTALVDKDVPTYWRFLWVYASVFVVGTPIVVYYSYIQDRLGLLWRRWLTDRFLVDYFADRAYYGLNAQGAIDNPDQRIAEDIRSFTSTSLSFLLIILNSVISLIAFTGILWSISVPLVVILLVYSVFGTIVTVWFGQRLIGLNFNQLRQEANFRYSLVRVRDHAESIAFYRGEAQESMQVRQRLIQALRNFNGLIGWQRNLGFFTQGYNYFAMILPAFVVAPLYFTGQIDFGAISQASLAFDQVLGALSLIVSQFNSISAFVAGVQRLSSFKAAIDTPAALSPAASPLHIQEQPDFALADFTLYTPNYQKVLLQDLALELQPGQGLLIMGQSGCGKSSLLRSIAGLWSSASGVLTRPPLEQMLFLPQHPYMTAGNLRDQLLYPQVDRSVKETQLCAVLAQVNLADLPQRVGGFAAELDWTDLLSLGEQQRLAFARLFLAAPAYAILDEATSALDLSNEARLYRQLQSLGMTFISVGHRTSLVQYHQWILELDGQTGWQLSHASQLDREMAPH